MRLLTSFLLWLMMLAIPVQGFAAASMLYCGTDPEHHAMQTQSVPESHHESGSKADMHDEIGVAGEQADQAHDMTGKLPNSEHKCGVCASCCNLIAIADVSSSGTAATSPPAHYLEPLAQTYAVPSRLLERPPRS